MPALFPMAPPEDGGFSSTVSYSSGMYHLIEYSLVAAGFALLAGFVYSVMTRSELGPKYRTASHASALLQLIAAVAYLALFVTFQNGFDYVGGAYVPDPGSRYSTGLRYADWSITVPLLMVELLSVCTLAGARLRNARAIGIGSAFLMIITGFFGAQVFSDGTSSTWLNIWAAVSTLFFIPMYVVGIKAVLEARRSISAEAGRSLGNAAILLYSVFGAYPLIYLIQVLVHPGISAAALTAWAVVTEVAFSFSDILAKVGFGALIHKIAKVRTADDVNSGEESHPEEVWISHVRHADAWPPLADALSRSGVLAGAGNGSDGRDGRGAYDGRGASGGRGGAGRAGGRYGDGRDEFGDGVVEEVVITETMDDPDPRRGR